MEDISCMNALRQPIDQCQYGQKTWGSDGRLTEFVKKPIKFMTNAPEVAAHLQNDVPTSTDMNIFMVRKPPGRLDTPEGFVKPYVKAYRTS